LPTRWVRRAPPRRARARHAATRGATARDGVVLDARRARGARERRFGARATREGSKTRRLEGATDADARED